MNLKISLFVGLFLLAMVSFANGIPDCRPKGNKTFSRNGHVLDIICLFNLWLFFIPGCFWVPRVGCCGRRCDNPSPRCPLVADDITGGWLSQNIRYYWINLTKNNKDPQIWIPFFVTLSSTLPKSLTLTSTLLWPVKSSQCSNCKLSLIIILICFFPRKWIK